jgi:amino acid transporter
MSMMVLPMQTIYDHPSDMLAEMAGELGGYGFKAFLCADAIFILCGGVLTALVGVSGLLGRLAKDRVLPEVFGYTNAGGSYYIAITIFVIVAVTLFLAIYDPEDPTAINNFGGVFAISFLSVLTAFGCGAVLLKLYRPRIARLVIANWSVKTLETCFRLSYFFQVANNCFNFGGLRWSYWKYCLNPKRLLPLSGLFSRIPCCGYLYVSSGRNFNVWHLDGKDMFH